MSFSSIRCDDFVVALASKEPVPGGGGASALVGALGTALGNMVGSLTVGKKKCADVEEDILEMKQKADQLQQRFLELIDEDAEGFFPLSQAYGLPRETPEQQAHKEKVMESALRTACSAPLSIMEACCEAIELMKEFAEKGSVIAISDAGCGAAFCRGALSAASLNVFINTKSMKDRAYAEDVNQKAHAMMDTYLPMCDDIFAKVMARF